LIPKARRLTVSGKRPRKFEGMDWRFGAGPAFDREREMSASIEFTLIVGQ
jgi:hypothetical protein